jgi:hypothetical protein
LRFVGLALWESEMGIDVRPMALEETGAIIEYFHDAAPAHLEMLRVDPTRLPPAATWRES